MGVSPFELVLGGAGQGRVGQGREGEGRAGQGRAGQGRAGEGREGGNGQMATAEGELHKQMRVTVLVKSASAARR